jgi:DNA polymerase-3 subunit alpha
MQAGAAALSDRRSGQKNLFGGFSTRMTARIKRPRPATLPDCGEFEERERLAMEKEVLGYYLSSHPLSEYAAMLSEFCSHTTDKLADLPDRMEVFLGGMLSSIKITNTKNSRPGRPTRYAMFDLEDTAALSAASSGRMTS